ncbi:MAG TPA: TlyA family RNA methyltransferase [Armatimonadetes bacterium]|nr:TlyA family RNA methyltransferase [Armatimonadota bacterium]
MSKVRLDCLLVKRGLATSRSRAQATILAGQVWVEGELVDKPGTKVRADAAVEVRGPGLPYVSRGGLKLEHALRAFALDVRGWVCLDVGASTGGFTDCLLQHGARRVYAVDVGYGQLHPKLRSDPRVVVRERTNARTLTPDFLPEQVDLATVDVSFISLTLVLPPVWSLLRPPGVVVALVKPQFEAGRGQVGKGGVVRDQAVHQAVLRQLGKFGAEHGWPVVGLTPSPLRGPKGNCEFWLLMRRGEAKEPAEEIVAQVVAEAHRNLAKEAKHVA